MTARSLRLVALGLPAIWMTAFFLAPFAILLSIGFGESVEGLPPYAAPLRRGPDGWVLAPTAANFTLLVEDAFYRDALLRSLRVATVSALLCLLLGYPMALGIARAPARWRMALLLAVMLPFWTSFLLRVTAWIGILQDQGWLNGALLALGVVEAPIPMLYSDFALYLGMTYGYLPFAVLPLYASLSKQDPALLEAAADLGAPPLRAFVTVTLPLSLPGVLAAFLLVFIPAVGEFVIPELLGGPSAQLLGRVVWTEFFQNRDWPLAAALAIALLLLLVLPIAIFQQRAARS
jgi:putrescine transport system permease protein